MAAPDPLPRFSTGTDEMTEAEIQALIDASISAATAADLAAIPPTTQAGTSYTFALSDLLAPIEATNASEATFTIPLFSAVEFQPGDILMVWATGAGGVTLSTAGITLKGSTPNTTSAQNGSLLLLNWDEDVWSVGNGESA